MTRFIDRLEPRPRDEHGSVTLWVVLLAVAMLSVAGLVIDGGYALSAKRQAMNRAEQASRVGADALNTAALRSGEVQVSPQRAHAAASAYLRGAGATGQVSVSGGEVTVVVTDHSRTAILSAIGVGSIPVTATATAESIDENS